MGRPGYDLDAVLLVAARTFTERGYDGTSMEDLAGRLGVTKSAIYHHVAGKQELLRLATDRALDGLTAVVEEATAHDGPAIERLSRPLRRALTGSETEIPRLGETIVRTVMVGSTDTVASARIYAELVISPNIEGIGLVEWPALPRVYELGRAAAREALASDPDLGSRLGI